MQKNNKTSRVQRKLCLESYIRHPAISCLRVWQWLRKSVHIRSYSGQYFPAFKLNTQRYGVSLRIQSECGKIRTRISPNTDTFCRVMWLEIGPHARPWIGRIAELEFDWIKFLFNSVMVWYRETYFKGNSFDEWVKSLR